MNGRIWIVLAGLLGASGVGLGAFHAHGLTNWLAKQELSEPEIAKRAANCETAVRYQMYHSLALFGVGLLARGRQNSRTKLAGGLFVLGTLLFSGGLYLFVFTGDLLHWAIVPVGGLCLIAGWLALAAVDCCGAKTQPGGIEPPGC